MDRKGASENSGVGGAMFHIGAVSELTGLKPETIRVWERRYHAVKPLSLIHI